MAVLVAFGAMTQFPQDEAGYQVHLANTAAIQQYEGIKHSNDFSDAQWLAHLLRLGILPTGTILPKEQRVVRDLARKRSQLVRNRTAQILSVENIMARQLGGRMTSNQIKQLSAETVDEMSVPMDVGLAMKANLAVIATLSEQIGVIEKRSTPIPIRAREPGAGTSTNLLPKLDHSSKPASEEKWVPKEL